ncbi:FIG024746: hypothetical protein [hydrothermal vent metagenome]|uniref:Low-complexity protein n=1 Tax=hydrothermal vent metagenome TaxID=652676 RepID=A0A3B0WNX4_9ZZZZ
MKNTIKKSLSVALGTTFVAAMSASPVVNADANPFGMQNLESGYMQVAEGKCGEGKCGGDKGDGKGKKEGKCGEGKCGGDKGHKDHKDHKDGEGKAKKEGKCGEGKCGGKK